MSSPAAQLAGLLEKLESLSHAAGTNAAEAASTVRRAIAGDGAGGSKIPPDRVTVTYDQPWVNFQGNLRQPVVERQYAVGNRPSGQWTDGVENVRLVVRESESDGRSLRSTGSTWSSSPVSLTPLYLIQCAGLSGPGPVIDPSQLAPGVDPKLVAHVQAGMVIQSLNEWLEARGQSLKVMGGNAGQNIAGAAATGTHGSWIDRRAVADTLHAVALVGAGGKPCWIEPASRPLTAPSFTAWGLFEVVRDDALFAAAQVPVGALGVVTSVVLDVDPLYFIDFTRVQRPFDAPLKKAVYDLDLSGLDLPGRPAHFEVVLNPYLLGDGQNGAFMETGFVVPPAGALPPPKIDPPSFPEISAHLTGDQLWGYLADLLSRLPWLVPPILDLILPYVFPPSHTRGPLSKVWPRSTSGPPLVSTELAVPQERTQETLDLLLSHIESAKPSFYWPGVFGIRFGKQTEALLGFTRFERWCTMELLYLRGVKGVDAFLRDFYGAMTARKIPYAVHWGQVNDLTAAQVVATYGEAALARWQAARKRLGAEGKAFANATTDAWGLT